jgi:hypothetical protein
MTTKDQFIISYNSESDTVTVTKSVKDGHSFDAALATGRSLLAYFHKTRVGKDSGCDSLGYSILKRIGVVRVNRSGVGPIRFREGVEAIANRNSHQERPVT